MIFIKILSDSQTSWLVRTAFYSWEQNAGNFLITWATDTLLETEQTHRVTLPENWHSSLLHHRTLGTRHPLPPHGILVLHQIMCDYLILYTYIHCQDARDLDIIVFCFCFWFSFLVFCFFGFFFCFFVFWFVVTYCTQLLSHAMYNLMMATTMAETCSC